MRGGIDPGMPVFTSGMLELCMYGTIPNSGMGPYNPRGWRDTDHHSQSSINHPTGFGFPHLVGRYRPGRCARFRPRVVGVVMYGRVYGPGVGSYRPRVRRNLALVEPGKPRRALAPWAPVKSLTSQ